MQTSLESQRYKKGWRLVLLSSWSSSSWSSSSWSSWSSPLYFPFLFLHLASLWAFHTELRNHLSIQQHQLSDGDHADTKPHPGSGLVTLILRPWGLVAGHCCCGHGQWNCPVHFGGQCPRACFGHQRAGSPVVQIWVVSSSIKCHIFVNSNQKSKASKCTYGNTEK